MGTSMSGIAQFVAKRGLGELVRWADEGYAAVQQYDNSFSEWLAIPRSVKTTCIKPSGTVSLLAGATPGMHFPESRFYIRRVRLGATSPLVGPLQAAGYHVEPAVEDPVRKVVVSFPVDAGEGVRTLDSVSMWEQLSLAALLQRHWADNAVSCTVTFDPAREGSDVPRALEYFDRQLKGVAFLPRAEKAAYQQMPYEAITPEQYASSAAALRPLPLPAVVSSSLQTDGSSALASGAAVMSAAPDLFCDAEGCSLDGRTPRSP